ncbi:MAG: hypothetical protein AAFO29_19905, partial [Actinomycetota bacterium]
MTETVAVAIDTADLADFVSRGERHVAALDRITVELIAAHRRNESVGLPPRSPGLDGRQAVQHLGDLIQVATATNRFVEEIRIELVTIGLDPADPLGVTTGGLGLRLTDTERDRLVEAIATGTGPHGGDVPADHFPPAYLELVDINRAIAALDAERDQADGRLLIPFDGDEDRVARIDAELDSLQDRRATLADRLGATDRGAVSEVDAIAIVARWTGGPRWAGRRYADWVEGHRDDLTTNGGRLVLHEPAASHHLTAVAEAVAADPSTAVAFFN